jgi:hypothetical protein
LGRLGGFITPQPLELELVDCMPIRSHYE